MEIPLSHGSAERLYGPEFAVNPAELYREMRAKHGDIAPILLEGDVPAWIVLSYRQAHYVLNNPDHFARDSRRWNLWDQIPARWPLLPFVAWSPSVVFAEGAEHQRRAGAISDVLDDLDHAYLIYACERVADQLIDGFADNGQADLMTQYAQQIPFRVVARLNDISAEEIAATAVDMMIASTQGPDSIEAYERGLERITRRVREFRSRPGSGIGAALVAHPARLTDEEATMDLLMLMKSAQQPTSDWLGNALRLMLTDDQFSLALQGGRSSADQALNEVLWKETPVQNLIGRWATQDFDAGQQVIRKGDLLVIGLAAANTDPHVQPESFREMSANRAHMSFATGEHSCPFAAPEIAETCVRTAIEVLLDRIPDVRLGVPPDDLQWRESAWDRGLKSLPAVFTPVSVMNRGV